MFGSLVLLALTPAAPVPKTPPPPVQVSAKRAVHPPLRLDNGGAIQLVPIDDGHYVEVTVKNTSKDTIRITYSRSLCDRFYPKVTDAKGAEVSERDYHCTFYSPTGIDEPPEVRELRPGDSLSVLVNLKQDWPEEKDKRKPGKYKARIVFESGKLRAESAETFELEVLK